MSSHHIVRDNQEPALLLATPHLPGELLGQLLEWSPVVGVLEEASDSALEAGIKVDAVFCSPEGKSHAQANFSHQQPIQLVEGGWPEALRWFAARRHEYLTIVCDFSPESVPTLAEDSPTLILVCEGWRAYRHRGGIWEKWLPQGQQIRASAPALEAENAFEEGDRVWKALKTGMMRLNFVQETWIFEQL